MGENQHYIPQYYQKSWADKNKKVYRYNKKANRISHVAIRNNCSESYGYECDKERPTDIVEGFYKERDDKLSDKYFRLIKNITCPLCVRLSQDDKKTLCSLYVDLYTRNPDYITNNPFNQFVSNHFTIFDDLSKTTEKEKEIEKRAKSILAAYSSAMNVDSNKYSVIVFVSNKDNIIFCSPLIKGLIALNPRCFAIVFDFYNPVIDKSIFRDNDGLYVKDCYLKVDNVTDIFSHRKDLLEDFKKEWNKLKEPNK